MFKAQRKQNCPNQREFKSIVLMKLKPDFAVFKQDPHTETYRKELLKKHALLSSVEYDPKTISQKNNAILIIRINIELGDLKENCTRKIKQLRKTSFKTIAIKKRPTIFLNKELERF